MNISLIPSEVRIGIAVAVTVVIIGTGAYGYGKYHNLKDELANAKETITTLTADNATLKANQAQLESTAKVNEETIKALRADNDKAKVVIKEVAKRTERKHVAQKPVQPGTDGPLAPVLRDALASIQEGK